MMAGNRIASALLVIAAGSGAALAADHAMKVNEVLLSAEGSTANQFIELEDPGEPFPNGPYGLQVFDQDGVGSTVQDLNVQAGTTRITAATAGARAAFGLGDPGNVGSVYIVDLTLPLPANGTACFTRGTGASPPKIHCMSWGTVNSIPPGPFNAPVNMGPAPEDGMSLQRRGSSCASVATPTPNATNSSPMCGMGGGDGGMTGDGGGDEDGGVDAGNNNGNGGGGGGDDGGCDVGAGTGWLGFVGLAGVIIGVRGIRRRSKRQR